MPDFGQFPDPRTQADYDAAYAEAKAFYGDAPRTIVVSPCRSLARLDMDGCGYRCTECLAVVGGAGCVCTTEAVQPGAK